MTLNVITFRVFFISFSFFDEEWRKNIVVFLECEEEVIS